MCKHGRCYMCGDVDDLNEKGICELCADLLDEGELLSADDEGDDMDSNLDGEQLFIERDE